MSATSVPSFRIARLGAQWAAVAVVLTALGCSGSNATAPANSPAASDDPPQIAPSVDAMVSGDLHAGLATMGLYDYRLDPKSGEFTLTPGRAVAAVGDAFALDLTSAFTTNAFGCASCLKVSGIERVAGPDPLLKVSFTATHPFGDTLTANRADLHINNVRLVLLEQGSDAFFGDAGNASVAGRVDLVTNASGYTALPSTFVTPPAGITSTLFPFVVFKTGDPLGAPAGNFSATTGWDGVLNLPEGYNVFPMGGSASTGVVFDLNAAGDSILEGQIALLGNYIVSAGNKAERPTPNYYMPEGAMPEAWMVDVTAPTTLDASPTQQIASVGVSVADWQHGGTVDAGFPGANKNGLKADGDVTSVEVSVPAFSATSFSSTTPTGGSGTLAAPLTFDVAITKPASYTTPGEVTGLVKITDARTNFNAIDESLNAGTGLSQLAEVATYQPFVMTLENPNTAPTCSGYTVNGAAPSPIVTVPFGHNAGVVSLAFDFLNDPDGTVTNVDVDWSYNGTTFNVEGNLTAAGTLNAPAPYSAPATIAIRFTDDELATTLCTFNVVIYAPTTTIGASTTYIGPSQFSNVSGNGSDMSVARIPIQMVSHGNNVYVVCRNDAAGGTITYIARSTDGGVTWPAASSLQIAPGLAAAGAFKFNALSIALNSDGTTLGIFGINNAFGSTSSGNCVFSKINTSTFTLDANVRGVLLDDATNGFDPTYNTNIESVLVASPTDPQLMFVLSDDTTTRMARLCRVGNVKNATAAGINVANSITLARCATTGNAMQVNGITAMSIFDPVMYYEPTNNAIHIVAEPGLGVPTTAYMSYRKYLVGSDTFEGASDTQFNMFETGATNGEREPGVVAGTDGRPVVVSRSDSSSGNDKARITKAQNATPPYNFLPAKNLTPTWSTATNHNQEKPCITIDRATGLIYVAIADTRDSPGESTPDASISIWETVFDGNLNCLINGRKLDAPGLGDNQDADRTARVWITQDGAPTTKRWIYFWQDASRKNIAGQPDLICRTAQ